MFSLLARNKIEAVEDEGAYASRHELPACRFRVTSQKSVDALFVVLEEAIPGRGYVIDELYWYENWSWERSQTLNRRKFKSISVKAVAISKLRRWIRTGEYRIDPSEEAEAAGE
jgi:hypothetical protein